MTILIIWWVVPAAILILRAAVTAYQTRKLHKRLKEVEEKATPFTRKL